MSPFTPTGCSRPAGVGRTSGRHHRGPTHEEPTHEEPTHEEPTYEEPTHEEPTPAVAGSHRSAAEGRVLADGDVHRGHAHLRAGGSGHRHRVAVQCAVRREGRADIRTGPTGRAGA